MDQMNIKKGLLILGIIILVGLSTCLWKRGDLSPKLEPIIFSNKIYFDYRRQVANRMNAKTQEITEQQVLPGSWTYTAASDVEIALLDLNDDDIPEILALIGSRYYTSGVGGIELEMYSQTKDGLRSITKAAMIGEVDGKPYTVIDTGVQTSRHLAKVRHKTKGYHDLCWFIETCQPEKDRKHFLAWNSGNYGYVKSEKLTDDERELFDNENIR